MNNNDTDSGGMYHSLDGLSLPGTQRLVRMVVANIFESLQPLLTRMFANVDDYFFDMSEKFDTAELRSLNFEAMRCIRSHRETITERFFENLTNSAQKAWGEVPKVRDSMTNVIVGRFSRDDMAILNDAEMDVSAALTAIVSKGNSQYGYELERLTNAINSISKRASVDDSTNPLGVRAIARSFSDAVAPLKLDVQILLCFLKLFERDVADALGRIYSLAIAQLESSGVSVASSTVRVKRAEKRPDNESTATAFSGAVDFADLRKCLSNSGVGGGWPTGEDQTAIGTDQLIDSVCALQQQFSRLLAPGETGNHHILPSLKTFLLSLPTEQAAFRKAGKVEQDTLQLISGLFEHMFRNENMSIPSKALIARLQFPVLRVALLDNSIFSNPDHSARKLINRLAADGIGWPINAVLLERNQLYRAAEALICRINDEFIDDVSMFDRFLDEWNDQAANKRNRIENAERRVNESALGAAKLAAAKAIVNQFLKKRAAGRRLSPVVASFISNEWTNALVMTCIKYGTDSDEWDAASKALDDLLAACVPAAMKEQASQRRAAMQDLVPRLGRALSLSSMPGSDVSDVLDAIVVTLEKLDDEDSQWFSGSAEYSVESLEISEEITMQSLQLDGIGTKADSRLSTLAAGDWIEIDGSDGPMRCKLIVVIEATQTYVFSNDVGLKVCEKSGAELVQGLDSGSIRIVREELIVERAVDELLAELRESMRV